MENEEVKNTEEPQEDQSFFGVIVHSFFVIPFLIAVFCVLLFTAVNMLTREQRTVYDYIEDVKTGGLTKRWQAAFELSKILANPDLIPDDPRFIAEITNSFADSMHDDNRVRQYLALAMGRTGREEFFEPLIANIKDEKEENLYAIIYALGMLQDNRAIPVLKEYIDHPNARIRSGTVASLGNIGDLRAKEILKKTLSDSEPNVQWGSAISLAQMGDDAGKGILAQLLSRDYLSKFPAIDSNEQNHLLLASIEAAAKLNDDDLNQIIKKLSQTDQNMKVRAKAQNVLIK